MCRFRPTLAEQGLLESVAQGLCDSLAKGMCNLRGQRHEVGEIDRGVYPMVVEL